MSDFNGRIGGHTPSSHSWMAPLVEDMLCNVRTGLTKAVVAGPDRAVLFYGRCSMGEGLMVDKARDAAFLLTGSGTWVGKSASSLQTQWQHKRVKKPLLKPYWIIKLRQGDQDIPMWIHQYICPSGSNTLGVPLQKTHLEMLVLTICHHPISPQGARSVKDIGETKGLNHLSSLHLLQTLVSRAILVHYQQCLQCHPDLTSQMDQVIPDEVDNTEKKHVWR